MESNQETQNTVATDVVVEAYPKPKMINLLKAGWEFTKTRKDLIQWYMLTMVGIAIVGSDIVLESNGLLMFVGAIAVFVLIIFAMLNTWSLIYAVSQPNTSEVTYKQSFTWASANFFPMLWTGILSGIAMIVGYILLIIPGVILSIYLYFAYYAQAEGSGAGTKALKKSYEAVKGRWWLTAWKLLVFGFYIMLIYIVGAIIYGILYGLSGENEIVILIADIFLQGIAGGVIGIITLHALAHYYQYLKQTQVVTVDKPQ